MFGLLTLDLECFFNLLLKSKIPHKVRVFPAAPASLIPALSDFHSSSHSLQRQTTERVERCRHKFTEFETEPGRLPPSSVSASLPLKCVCLIASESLH